MCEKPVTPTVKEAEELAALAKEKNLVFCVYQNRRWDSDFLTLQQLLKDGSVSETVASMNMSADVCSSAPFTSSTLVSTGTALCPPTTSRVDGRRRPASTTRRSTTSARTLSTRL